MKQKAEQECQRMDFVLSKEKKTARKRTEVQEIAEFQKTVSAATKKSPNQIL